MDFDQIVTKVSTIDNYHIQAITKNNSTKPNLTNNNFMGFNRTTAKAYVKKFLYPFPHFRRRVVFMVDGLHTHGGLTDRFRTALSLYYVCKKENVPFFIYYVYPCDLSLILKPNQYNWIINKRDISHSFWDSKDIYIYNTGILGMKYLDASALILEERVGTELKKKKKKQYLIYGNSFFRPGLIDYKSLFNELFTHSLYLKEQINKHSKLFMETYEAVTLRFQQLLGDFSEGQFEILPKEERTLLIEKCVDKIEELYKNNYFSTEKILITTDSPSFMKEISKKSYVYTIPGKMEHMDFTHNADLEMNTKSFVDLYLLMRAKKITLLRTGKMYRSGFPAFAAELGNIEYVDFLFN